MEWDDVVDVLTTIAAYDRRKNGNVDIHAWQAAFRQAGVASKADAIQAVVEYYTQSRDWIMPADVIARVKAIRAARIERVPEADLMQDYGAIEAGQSARDYVTALRARTRLLGDGLSLPEVIASTPKAITAGAR